MDVSLPNVRMPLIDDQGCMTSPFYRYFQNASQSTGPSTTTLQDEINTIATVLGSPDGSVSDIPPIDLNAFLLKTTLVTGLDSVFVSGSLANGQVTVSLLNDSPVPPSLSFYGCTQGQRGWQTFSPNFVNASGALDLSKPGNSGAGTLQAVTVDAFGRVTGTRAATITGTAGRVTVANGDASAGLPTIDLATVADAGGGALLRFVRDAWGRLSGTSAATTSDLAEGANLYFTAARVLATILTGLSTATNAAITAADTVLSALGKLQTQITGNAAIPAGYIDGLKMVWNSATSISVTSGNTYIQASSAVISFPSTLTLSSLILTASTWYHLYGYLNAGVPAIELVTTAPASPYSGTARAKTGDTSRRYIGSVLTDASGQVKNFAMDGNYIRYLTPSISIGSGLNATTQTNLNCASAVPITASRVDLRAINGDTNAAINLVLGGGGVGSLIAVLASSSAYFMMPLDSSQNINYNYSSTPTGSAVVVGVGYTYER